MKKSIFISYRRDDSAGHTRALATRLQQRFGENRVFLDVDDIRSGENFIDKIEQAGCATRALLAVIGPNWLTAADQHGARRLDDPKDYVRAEIRTALERGILVIPVLVGDAKLPATELLPDDLRPLTRRNALEIRHSRFADDVAHLAQDLQASTGLRPVAQPGRQARSIGSRARRLLAAVAALAVLSSLLIYMSRRPEPEADGLTDLFAVLEAQGYVANAGFSGNYQPGNIVRTAEQAPDGGERRLAQPVVFMWGTDCFEGSKSRDSAFVIADSEGSSTASLTLGSDALRRWLPAFSIADNAASSYSLSFENTHVQTFALADLSGAFSPRCVQALSGALAAGDAADWFAIVVEAVVADGLSMHVDWQSTLNAGARAAIAESARDALQQLTSAPQTPATSDNARIEIQDRERTVISAPGPLIVAYRVRPIQPRYGD